MFLHQRSKLAWFCTPRTTGEVASPAQGTMLMHAGWPPCCDIGLCCSDDNTMSWTHIRGHACHAYAPHFEHIPLSSIS